MILLKKLELTNFLSHKKTELKFENNQRIIIDGVSGSGKSTLVDSVVWCFFGKGRSDNKSLIKRGTKKAIVEIILEDDKTKKEYKIERSIDSSNKHDLIIRESKDGEKFSLIKTTGIKGAQTYIEKEILHSTYILFINSIINLQDNSESFIDISASKRKDILLEIVGAAKYDDYLKKAKEELQKNKTEFEVIESNIDNKVSSIKQDNNIVKQLKDCEKKDKEFKEIKKVLEIEEKELIEKQKEYIKKESNFDATNERMRENLKLYDKKSADLSDCNAKIIELSSVDTTSLKEQIKILPQKKDELQQLEKSREEVNKWNDKINVIIRSAPTDHDYDEDIKEINKQLVDVMTEDIPGCPKCGYSNPILEENKNKRIDSLKSRLVELSNKKAEYLKLKNEHAQKIKELGDTPIFNEITFRKLKDEITELEQAEKRLLLMSGNEKIIAEKTAEIIKIKKEQVELKKEIEKNEKILAEQNTFKEEKKKTDSELVEILSKQTKNEMIIEKNGYRLAVAKKAQESSKEHAKELKKLSDNKQKTKENIESLEIIKDAFGPTGIKTLILDYAIPELEDKINNILETLTEFRVNLDTQKSGLSKDNILLEGLFINIINDQGEKLDFSNFSGGEKIKISVAISEGLAGLSNINFRFLDETVVALDNESILNFMAAINNVMLNVQQVFCISHIQEIKDIFNEKVLVTKKNGNSQIAYV